MILNLIHLLNVVRQSQKYQPQQKRKWMCLSKSKSKSKSKPIALSLVSPFADSYVLKSRTLPTINGLFDKKYLDLTYPELLSVCNKTEIEISKEQITQVETDTITQAKGNNFLSTGQGELELLNVRLHVTQTLPYPLSPLFNPFATQS